MTQVDFLIIGGGIAGTSAAEAIRSKDPNSSIYIITQEPNRLYSRVLLPHFLRNENSQESLFVRKKENYSEKNIILQTSTTVSKVDSLSKTVETTDGEEYCYKKLLIASGGKVNKLEIPGADLPEVTYLRTVEDAVAIKNLMARSREAVVYGGGFIAIEFALSFIKNGLKTTAIIREKSFWEAVVGENSAKLLSKILEENGVIILSESQIKEFSGQGKLENVVLENEVRVKADIAGIGIGIHLDTDYLKDSGLDINKGVLTNEFLETSAPNVWAAGDVAEFFDPVTNKYHSLGNWANASSQGRTVGLSMSAERTIFETTSMYSINIFGNNFSFLGDPVPDGDTEIIERGSLADKKLARLLIREDRIVGASLVNMPLERNFITKLVSSKTLLTDSKAKLADLSFDLSSLL